MPEVQQVMIAWFFLTVVVVSEAHQQQIFCAVVGVLFTVVGISEAHQQRHTA